jgi:glucose-6-phosphate 1-dehydrogenase
LDAIYGDQSLFTHADAIELAWQMVDSVLAGWNGEKAPELSSYQAGSWGPIQAEELLQKDGRHWSMGCLHQ